tara:strand:+ start:332 stop:463 length:132 start_codon:yes stop_codon:yes gene_type:complete
MLALSLAMLALSLAMLALTIAMLALDILPKDTLLKTLGERSIQ